MERLLGHRRGHGAERPDNRPSSSTSSGNSWAPSRRARTGASLYNPRRRRDAGAAENGPDSKSVGVRKDPRGFESLSLRHILLHLNIMQASRPSTCRQSEKQVGGVPIQVARSPEPGLSAVVGGISACSTFSFRRVWLSCRCRSGVLLAASLALASTTALADHRSGHGYTARTLGASIPDATGVIVNQVEGSTDREWPADLDAGTSWTRVLRQQDRQRLQCSRPRPDCHADGCWRGLYGHTVSIAPAMAEIPPSSGWSLQTAVNGVGVPGRIFRQNRQPQLGRQRRYRRHLRPAPGGLAGGD